MMFVKQTLRALVLLCAAATIAILCTNEPAWALTTQVTPRDIPIDLLYHGAQLNITGNSDANDDLIITISSEPEDAHMKFKGKAAGLFWMKIGDMSFEHVPTAYLLASSNSLDSILPVNERIKEGIGLESIKAGAKLESSAPDMDPERWIDEFIQFKQAEKLYRVQEGAIQKSQGTYQLDINWPYQAAPGTYTVEVLAVRNGKIMDRSETSITVERAGIVAQLSGLAFNHAAIYGIVAIVIAMAAGFAVGALFKGDGGAH